MSTEKQRPREECLAEKLGRAVADDPRLEAVTIHPEDKSIEIATLGEDRGGAVEGRVREIIDSASAECGLLEGTCPVCHDHNRALRSNARVEVTSEGASVRIEKRTCETAHTFWRWKRLHWPQIVQRQPPVLEAHDHGSEWKMLATLSSACLGFAIAGWLAASLGAPAWVPIALYAVAYLAGGWDAAGESFARLRRGELDVHFLMLAVALGAAAIGAFGEGALLLFLFSASGAMEHFAQGRTQREIGALLRGAPKTATVVGADGSGSEEPVETLAPGDLVRVTSGAQAPLDLQVVRGESEFDESSLTGEARPISKRSGDVVLAGTMNLWGVVEGRVLRPASESALQKMIRLIHEAQHLKAPSQRFTDHFGTGYTYAVMGLCLAMFLYWWLAGGYPPFHGAESGPSAFYRAMTLLVVCSPCALVLSVPSAILSAIACAARRGVLFRGGAAVETLATIRVVAFDKTGTLTEGELHLERVEAFAGSEADVLQLAASIARYSEHPLSRAVRRAGIASAIDVVEADDLVSEAGQGLSGAIAGNRAALGREAFVRRIVTGMAAHNSTPLSADEAQVWVAGARGAAFGRLVFRDSLRPDAGPLLGDLKRQGLHLAMLTGDQPTAAQHLAKGLPLDEVRAGLLPEEKVQSVIELRKRYGRIAMIGDGVNDAASLAAADVGVAMGARGSDAALEQSEVVLLKDRIENFLLAYHLSRKSRVVIWQNLALSLGTVVAMASTIIFHGAPLALSVLAHEGSTVLVVLNSLRLLVAPGLPKPPSGGAPTG